MLEMLGHGFLGRPSTFGADLNLLAQVGVGLLLVIGLVLARRARYRWHAVCQTTALGLTLAMTAVWMAPAYHSTYGPAIFRLGNRVNVAVAAHVLTGTAALLLGLYVVLVAGTPLVPSRLRFLNYKAWMRTLIALWWVALLLGLLTYWWATT